MFQAQPNNQTSTSYSDLFEEFFRTDSQSAEALTYQNECMPGVALPIYQQQDLFFSADSLMDIAPYDYRSQEQQPQSHNQTQFFQHDAGQTQFHPQSQQPQDQCLHTGSMHAAVGKAPGFMRTKVHNRRNQHMPTLGKKPHASNQAQSEKPTVALVSPNTLYQASMNAYPAFYQHQAPGMRGQSDFFPQPHFYGYPINDNGAGMYATPQQAIYRQFRNSSGGFYPDPAALQQLQPQPTQQQLNSGNVNAILSYLASPTAPMGESSNQPLSPRSPASPRMGHAGSNNSTSSEFVKQKLQAKIRARMLQKGQIPPNATNEELRFYGMQMAIGSEKHIQSCLPTPKASPRQSDPPLSIIKSSGLVHGKMGYEQPDIPSSRNGNNPSHDPRDPLVLAQPALSLPKLETEITLHPIADSSMPILYGMDGEMVIGNAPSVNGAVASNGANYDQFFSDFIIF